MPHSAAPVVVIDCANSAVSCAGSSGDPAPTLIGELEAAIARKDMRRQAEIMRRVTDLFMMSGTGFSGEHIALFDDVMVRLVAAIERSARATFGERLASFPNAPPKTIRALALDDSIDVAEPVLRRSENIDEGVLVEGAKTKSQDHLLAISRRKVISEPVTDVLVERGSQQVVVSVAGNAGAKFSDFGCSALADRAKDDGELALRVWSRLDIPRQHLLSLFTAASEAVRKELEAADRPKTELYRYMVAEAASKIHTTVRRGSESYGLARTHVESLHRADGLCEAHLLVFARAKKFDEATIALSLMCDLPIGHIERTIVEGHLDHLLVLAKAIELSWETTKEILLMRSTQKTDFGCEIEACQANFVKLQPKTAKAAMQFYRLRIRAATPMPN